MRGLFLSFLQFFYCGAIILFAPQKERVKALSEARLDRSYSSFVAGAIAKSAAFPSFFQFTAMS